MTKTAQFRIETLESRDAPKAVGSLVCGGAGEPSIMKGVREFRLANA